VLEDRETALEQIRPERLGFAIGEVPESRLPHERHGIPEEIRVVERQDPAAVGADVERGELLKNQAEVLLRARIVIVPCGAPAAAPRGGEIGLPTQTDEGEAAVVRDVVAIRAQAGRLVLR